MCRPNATAKRTRRPIQSPILIVGLEPVGPNGPCCLLPASVLPELCVPRPFISRSRSLCTLDDTAWPCAPRISWHSVQRPRSNLRSTCHVLLPLIKPPTVVPKSLQQHGRPEPSAPWRDARNTKHKETPPFLSVEPLGFPWGSFFLGLPDTPGRGLFNLGTTGMCVTKNRGRLRLVGLAGHFCTYLTSFYSISCFSISRGFICGVFWSSD